MSSESLGGIHTIHSTSITLRELRYSIRYSCCLWPPALCSYEIICTIVHGAYLCTRYIASEHTNVGLHNQHIDTNVCDHKPVYHLHVGLYVHVSHTISNHILMHQRTYSFMTQQVHAQFIFCQSP